MVSVPNNLAECATLISQIIEMPPAEIGRFDIALLNLLCAPGLRGSEGLSVRAAMERLDRLTAFVKSAIDRGLTSFRRDPAYGDSEPKWRMAMLVTKIKRDFGASYNPSARAELEAGINAPFTDSREVFIHGLLGDDPNRRWGTCTSIPVHVTAVARRLG